MKAKLYRLLALLFASLGLVIFIVLYFRNIESQGWEVFRSPKLIIMVLVPFLPAAVLIRISEKAEKRLAALREKNRPQSS